MTKSLHDLWCEYQEKFIPKSIRAAELTERKRAFYAGALRTLEALKDIVGGEQELEEEGVDYLFSLWQEAVAYLKSQRGDFN